MKANSLRRWSHPRVILVISTLTESPVHTLRVVSGLRPTGARLFLVQLPAAACAMFPLRRVIPFLLMAAPKSFEQQAGNGDGQAFLWAEILSEVTVLKNTPVDRILALVDSLGADQVVLTTPEIGRLPFRTGDSVNVDLFESLTLPILVFGPRMNKSSWSSHDFRNILVPVSLESNLELLMRFACRFARRHHGRVTVLHIFDHREVNTKPWERTPAAVGAKLPISELKREGIMCPMDISVSEGYPEQKILAFNEHKPHDLILMGGSRGRNLPGALGHSVPQAVMAEARCPVLILGGAGRLATNTVLSLKEPTVSCNQVPGVGTWVPLRFSRRRFSGMPNQMIQPPPTTSSPL